MESFTPVASTLGGAMIGASAAMMLLLHGRIAGVSGILGGVLTPRAGDFAWRLAFVLGLVAGGAVIWTLWPTAMENTAPRGLAVTALAGLLVGAGTRLGSGCTSGHGVCGISRLSPRSLVATATFMTTGTIAAFVGEHALRGLL